MPKARAKKIADAADRIVDGYAVLRHELGFRIVNLNTGHVAVVSSEFKVLETNMDDIEEQIAVHNLTDNIEFLAA